ncbi:MAG TPA: aminopeptidase N C-terminal domain-containing protein, partial [Cellvibrionaceae bacterium]
LANLIKRDSDGFNRWEASQTLALQVLDDAIKAYGAGQLDAFSVDPILLDSYQNLLDTPPEDKAMLALMLTLPSESYIAEQYSEVNVEAIHFARKRLAADIAQSLSVPFMAIVTAYDGQRAYSPDADQVAARALKNTALSYCMIAPDHSLLSLCERAFNEANNMTDQMAALSMLVNCEQAEAEPVAAAALERFYQQWQDEALVVNQWFALQARSAKAGALARVEALLRHPAYDGNNPNKIRSLISSFAAANPIGFHSGNPGDTSAGYRFLADHIIALNQKNPQIAAGLLRPLVQWRRYPPARGEAMRNQLTRISTTEGLSADVFEVVSKALAKPAV